MVKHGPKGPRALTQNTFINIYLLSSASATVCALKNLQTFLLDARTLNR